MAELLVDVVSPELSELNFLIHQQFDRLIDVCIFLEKVIRKEAKQRRVHAQRRRKQGQGEEERAFNSVAIDDYLFEIERDYPRLLRYALLVSMMSTVESCFVRLCRIADRLLTTVKFNEKAPCVIQRALAHLQDEAGLDTSRIRYYKDLAVGLQKLRNAVTHSGGCIKERNDKREIRAFAKSRTGVKIDKWRNIVLSSRFVSGNAHGMKNLFLQLHGKLKRQVYAKGQAGCSVLTLRKLEK